ncbi:hypothetical protein OEZ85_004924 [Tetradesmus obliquus]|uniref:Uncharacterized protein n=1 Tax=Tetradesmus obliquus TaxID=3088 RepID=A0ABY8UGB3_TETOB|nr:hypothetical protein OEZ85_004924 [Tetradesmus obliquus]
MARKPGFYVRQLQQLEEQLQLKQQRVEKLGLHKAALQQREQLLVQTIAQIGAAIDVTKDSATAGAEAIGAVLAGSSRCCRNAQQLLAWLR